MLEQLNSYRYELLITGDEEQSQGNAQLSNTNTTVITGDEAKDSAEYAAVKTTQSYDVFRE